MRVAKIIAISVIGILLGVVAVGCGPEYEGEGASSPEETTIYRTVEETIEKTVEETIASGADESMSQEEADAAKAAAAEEELTLEQVRELDASYGGYEADLLNGLLVCQAAKYDADHGPGASERFMNDYAVEVAEAPEEGVYSIHEAFLMEGYSCTIPEAMSYSG